ncbi:HdeD family acid-resistance protein [Shewanella marina]|uniref:HdeD family acid-resistance protein n=1 Tax=Shewanella marina TaxID=487319 RepID=UPI00047032F2|nr:DUF308 domain-containing protein [Shewanella marina]
MAAFDNMLQGAYKASKTWGYATIILGLLAIALPMAMGLAITILIGLVLVIAGFVQTGAAWPGEGRGFSVRLLLAVLTGIAGLVMLLMPQVGLASLTLMLCVYFLLDAGANFAVASQLRPHHGWGYVALGGFTSLLMALFIMWQWPVSTEFIIGILIGVKLLMLGVTMVLVARAGERMFSKQQQQQEKEINPKE